MLDVYDWLSNIYFEDDVVRHQIAEVRFKGTRKAFYRNVNNLALEIGQKVVVETTMGGYDVGEISLVGPLVKLQLKKYKVSENSEDIRKIYRVASDMDMDTWREAKGREYVTMMRSREFAIGLNLRMKISDVEYQGDNTKAIFYYTAEGRVDFRELIKVFAKNFKIKVEMRQIGLRQEAGRLGGIGSCGRELCCSTWLTDFHSVSTTAARYQNLFLNPLKLSGQCGRLKCCLNFELDTYLEALEKFPKESTIQLHTAKGLARSVKTDILKGVMFFVLQDDPTNKFIPLDIEDVKDLLAKQKRGEGGKIEDLEEFSVEEEPLEKEVSISGDIMADDLNRFEKKLKTNKRKKRRPNQQGRGQKSQAGPRNSNTPKPGQKPKNTQEPRNKEGVKEAGTRKPEGNKPRPSRKKPTGDRNTNAPTPKAGGDKPTETNNNGNRPKKNYKPRRNNRPNNGKNEPNKPANE